MIRHEVIGFVYTRTCPLSCRHCITESSPRARGKMGLEQARRYLKALPGSTEEIAFTGGEPLLFHHEIAALAREATALGLRAAVVTGCGWAGDQQATYKRIADLAE